MQIASQTYITITKLIVTNYCGNLSIKMDPQCLIPIVENEHQRAHNAIYKAHVSLMEPNKHLGEVDLELWRQ